MKNFKLLFSSILLIVLNACNKGDLPQTQEPTPITPAQFAQNNFGATTSRDFIGRVVDVTDQALPNTTVRIGTASTQTDANGMFIIKNATVNEKFAYITATKSGYLNGSKAVVPSAGTNSVKMILLPATTTATVNTGVSSNVNLPNGTKVNFDGNFKTASGTTYNGAVSVIVHHLDPADPKVNDKMPGMLFAQASNGDARVLETYGMVNVELKGSAGEKLQIVNPSIVEFPITASQQATAPATIPLWHFDETNGYWIEDGIATKSGNKYIGSVKHFSWVNVDIPFAPSFVSVKIVDGNGNSIPNLTVVISGGGNSGITNNNGQIGILTRLNAASTLSVLNPCGMVIHTQNINPNASTVTLPNIVITTTAAQTATVSGTLKKCNNSNVTNGYISYGYGGNTYFAPVVNGAFSFQTLICGSTPLTIVGQDFDSNTNTGMFNYNMTSPTTNVGNLTACNTIAESITYQIDGTPYKVVTSNLVGSVSGNSFTISGNTPSVNDQIAINGNSIIPGTYTTTSGFQMYGGGLSLAMSPTQQYNITYKLLNVGAVGQYIDLAFSGSYVEMMQTPMGLGNTGGGTVMMTRTITGTAHVLRDN